jgi:hypothetical protein
MGPHYYRLDVSKVVGQLKCGLNIFCSFDPRVPKSMRRKFHEPVIVHIH